MLCVNSDGRFHQGDILEDIEFSYPKVTETGHEIINIKIPYAVVVSQECDLFWDFKNRNNPEKKDEDKFIQTILVCPAFLEEDFKTGQYLTALGLRMQTWNTGNIEKIQKNNLSRYHFIEAKTGDPVPSLYIDFKHYYTLNNTFDKYQGNYRASLEVLYREQLSQRFAFYLSRIGLPEEINVPTPIVRHALEAS